MFSKFKETFINRPQFTTQIPDAVLATISKGLPEGFRYIEDHDGYCKLDCGGTMNIDVINIILPKEAQPIFDKMVNFTMDDVAAYAYNAQKPIELAPDAEGFYTINGEKIKDVDFVKAPLKDVQFTQGHFYLTTEPFPPAFPIDVSGNGFTLTLMARRQPMNSINEIKFATSDDAALQIVYTLDISKKNGTMQFSITMRNSNSASDVLASKEIFNAFCIGKGTFCGALIKSRDNISGKIVPAEVIQFWHRIVEVEKVLNVKFDVSQEITLRDVNTIDAFYRSFVGKKPFKIYKNDITLRGTGRFNEEKTESKEPLLGTEIMFEYVEHLKADILGISLVFHALVYFFNGIISEIATPINGTSGDFSITLVSADNKHLYSSTQYFLDQADLIAVRENKDHIKIFMESEELEKY